MAEHLKFTEDHLWVRVNGKRARIGLSDYGQDELGEIIAVELPDEGDSLEKGESFGEIESVKTVSDLIAPISGRILSTNGDLCASISTYQLSANVPNTTTPRIIVRGKKAALPHLRWGHKPECCFRSR